MLNNPNTDLVTLDIIAMLSKTESFLAFDEMGNVLTDYVFINGLIVMTSSYLLERGFCCGNKCTNCPYFPKHQKNNTTRA